MAGFVIPSHNIIPAHNVIPDLIGNPLYLAAGFTGGLSFRPKRIAVEKSIY
jgi:hypothetical protein